MVEYSGYQHMLVDRRGGIVSATLNAPPMNAIGADLHLEIMRFFHEVNLDLDAKVVVLTGAGDRAFSAGGDISTIQHDLADPNRPLWGKGLPTNKLIFQSVLNLSKPLIARVNGHAMGLGATLAILSDISIMVEQAKIADTHVKIGLAAGDGGALLWPILMGFARARRYLLTGDILTGREAADLGLITEAVPASDLDARVEHFAQQLAAGASIAINYTKIAINLLLRGMVDPLIEAHFGLEAQSALSSDHHEAVSAFVEGRSPQFTGR